MKIVKLCVIDDIHYVVFDEIPEITYEEKDGFLIGSYYDSSGRIVFSHYFRYSNTGKAFGAAGIKIKMKNGEERELRNNWFDHGYYTKHGEFYSIGASNIEKLKKLYLYRNYKINKHIFQDMLADYHSRDKVYSYGEIEDWIESEKEEK